MDLSYYIFGRKLWSVIDVNWPLFSVRNGEICSGGVQTNFSNFRVHV